MSTELFDVYETDPEGNTTTRFAYVTTRAQAEVLAQHLRTSRSTPAHVHVLPCTAPTREVGWRDLAPFLAALPAPEYVEFATRRARPALNILTTSVGDFGAWMTALGVEVVAPGRPGSRTARGMWRGWLVDLHADEPRPAEQTAATACTNCQVPHEECLEGVRDGAKACCGFCTITDTHGTANKATSTA